MSDQGPDEMYEREIRPRVEAQLIDSGLCPRELLPHGAWAPMRGMYDLGWKEWENLPAAGFVKELRRWDDDYSKEVANDPWAMDFAVMISRGELSLDQLRFYTAQHYIGIDPFVETLAKAVLQNAPNRDVRDLAARHLAEETGHSSIYEEFCVRGLGMNRERDLWEAKPVVRKGVKDTLFSQMMHAHIDDAAVTYAMIPFGERLLPKRNAMLAKAYRKVYDFPDDTLTFFDLHTYIDIYHERIGLWLLAKYAITNEQQERATQLLQGARKAKREQLRAIYDNMPHKR